MFFATNFSELVVFLLEQFLSHTHFKTCTQLAQFIESTNKWDINKYTNQNCIYNFWGEQENTMASFWELAGSKLKSYPRSNFNWSYEM